MILQVIDKTCIIEIHRGQTEKKGYLFYVKHVTQLYQLVLFDMFDVVVFFKSKRPRQPLAARYHITLDADY